MPGWAVRFIGVVRSRDPVSPCSSTIHIEFTVTLAAEPTNVERPCVVHVSAFNRARPTAVFANLRADELACLDRPANALPRRLGFSRVVGIKRRQSPLEIAGVCRLSAKPVVSVVFVAICSGFIWHGYSVMQSLVMGSKSTRPLRPRSIAAPDVVAVRGERDPCVRNRIGPVFSVLARILEPCRDVQLEPSCRAPAVPECVG